MRKGSHSYVVSRFPLRRACLILNMSRLILVSKPGSFEITGSGGMSTCWTIMCWTTSWAGSSDSLDPHRQHVEASWFADCSFNLNNDWGFILVVCTKVGLRKSRLSAVMAYTSNKHAVFCLIQRRDTVSSSHQRSYIVFLRWDFIKHRRGVCTCSFLPAQQRRFVGWWAGYVSNNHHLVSYMHF